jgi:SAM-dependent methyltransferase
MSRFYAALRSVWNERRANPIVIPFWRSFMLQPLPFFFWFRLRWYWFRLRRVPLKVFNQGAPGSDHISENVIPYNLRKSRGYDRTRTERLINVLRSVHGLDLDRARVLNIGPRNEMELMLLTLYGFRPENITAVDLFSYSPRIQVMDMHHLAFPDDSFDVTYCAYTLRYSDRVARACEEIARCTRNGGLVAASFVTEADPGAPPQGGERGAIIGSRLAGGLADLLSCFGSACAHVYWREEYEIAGPVEAEKHCSVIFRLSKDARPPGPS